MSKFLSIVSFATASWLVAAAAPAWAYSSELESRAAAGPCGGDIHCTHTQDEILYDPPTTTVLIANENQTISGAYADAFALTTFGTQGVYADGYNANIAVDGYAESRAISRVVDDLPADQLQVGSHVFHFSITGSHTDAEGEYAAAAYAYFQFVAYDDRTGALLDNTQWFSTDAAPTVNYNIMLTPSVGDGIDFTVYVEADAYTSSVEHGSFDGPHFVYSDYSHALSYYVTGPGGLIGASGHDYAINPLSGVPEPSTWLLTVLGLGSLGGVARGGRHSRRGIAAIA